MSDRIVFSEEEVSSNQKRHNIHDLPGSQRWKFNSTCVDDVEPENQTWLWDKIIPLETYTLFAGVGGIGKSQVLMFIAARVSDGEVFQMGGVDHKIDSGSVLLLSGEDSYKSQISPRLRALNANLKKIHLLKCAYNVQAPTKKRNICLDKDLEQLREEVVRHQDVKLIVVDPVMNFIGNVKDHVSSEVLNFLAGLNDIAEEFKLGMILNKHLRKQSSGANIDSAMNEVSGSGSWVNNARQSWIMCESPDDSDKKYFANLKVNIEKKNKKSFSFKIESTKIEHKGKLIDTSKIVWSDQIEDISINEIFNKVNFEKGKEEIVSQFILDQLKLGSKESSLIFNEAMNQKINRNTYFKVRASLLSTGQIVEDKIKDGYKKSIKILKLNF